MYIYLDIFEEYFQLWQLKTRSQDKLEFKTYLLIASSESFKFV